MTFSQSHRSRYHPPDTKSERFVYGKPVKGGDDSDESWGISGVVAWVLMFIG